MWRSKATAVVALAATVLLSAGCGQEESRIERAYAPGGTADSVPGTATTPSRRVASSTGAVPKAVAPSTSGRAAGSGDRARPRAAAPAPAGTPVAANGALRVCGVNLCNQAGRAIQLRGMSSHGLQFFPNCLNQASMAALRNDWRANLVRVSMYVQEGGLATDPAGFTRKVNEAVETASALGLYVIVDFHILTPGDPNTNLNLAKSFFADVAAAHAAKPNIIYEIANEPNGVSWSAIKRYAEQVIPVIRAEDPDGVVLIGTRGFSSLGLSDGSNETEIVNDPVAAKNVMYTFHFYAASHKDDRRQAVARAAKKLPLFVSEFGTQTFTGNGANDLASSTTWLDLLKSLKISYAMWSFSDSNDTNSALRPGTCSGKTFTGTGVLSESGRFIRDRLRQGAAA